MNTPLVRARALTRHYPAGKAVVSALDGVGFEINPGEFVALVGPSGSGKSTLLNLIGGLDRPSQGEVWVNELSLGPASDAQLVRYRRERIGFIFQSFHLLPTLSALENVMTPMTLAEVGKRERRERAWQLLKSVGLAERADHLPGELSGGEKQRVALARALANQPTLLLADEPTGNLDSQTGTTVLDLLCGLLKARGLTLILVTHDMQIAARADRIIHLCDGRIQRIENPGDTLCVKSNPKISDSTPEARPMERRFTTGFAHSNAPNRLETGAPPSQLGNRPVKLTAVRP